MSSVRRPGRQGRAEPAGKATPAAGRAADCGRRHGNPLRRGRQKDRSCRRKKRAGGCRNACRRMQKIQAGRRSALGGATMKTQEARSGDPAIRRSGDPAIRRSGDPAIRRSGDPAIRRSGDPAIRRSGDPAIRRSGDPAIRRSGDPAIRRSGDPAIRRSGDPAIRRYYTKGNPLSSCQPMHETIFRTPGDGCKRCAQRADPISSFLEYGHRDLSEPVARPAGAHSAQICRASPVPFTVPYAEHGTKARQPRVCKVSAHLHPLHDNGDALAVIGRHRAADRSTDIVHDHAGRSAVTIDRNPC